MKANLVDLRLRTIFASQNLINKIIFAYFIRITAAAIELTNINCRDNNLARICNTMAYRIHRKVESYA